MPTTTVTSSTSSKRIQEKSASTDTSNSIKIPSTEFLKKEIGILEEIVNILSKPSKYGISNKDIFTVFNSSSSMLDNIVNGPRLTSLSASHSNNGQSISIKMVDLQNLVALGQQLADKRKIIKIGSPTAVDDSLLTVNSIYKILSTHVYINHVKTPSSTAAVTAAAASSNENQSSWWNMIHSSKPITKTLDPKTNNGNEINKSLDINQNPIVTSTNPLESHDYFPDLRLVLKNVLILFISFFKRYDELILNVPSISKTEIELIKSLRDLMFLLNVSILHKLVEIFKMLNPTLTLRSEEEMINVLAQ